MNAQPLSFLSTMDLIKQLRCFLAVAEEGHVGRAAELIGMAQPALTQRMRVLQTELDVRLLERSGRGIALTEAGRYLAAETPAVLAAVDALADRTAEFALPADRPWTISVPTTLGPARLHELSERLSTLVVPRRCVVTGGSPDQRRDLDSADAAVLIVDGSGDFQLPLGAAMAPGHPLAGLPGLHPHDLEEDGLIILDEDDPGRDMIIAELSRQGLTPDRVEVGVPVAVAGGRALGGSVCLMDRTCASDLGLAWVPLVGAALSRGHRIDSIPAERHRRDALVQAVAATYAEDATPRVLPADDHSVATRARIGRLWQDVGVAGSLHAIDLGTGATIGIDADADWMLASVSKVALCVAAYRAEERGTVDLSRGVRLTPDGRSRGATGISVMADEVRMSLRDVMQLALILSDNAAADALWDAIGPVELRRRLQELPDVAGITLGEPFRDLYDRVLLADRSVDISSANRGSAQQLTTLLELIWTDRAARPEACAQIRDLMTRQVWRQRLRSGFAAENIDVAGKTGTFGSYRHEIGVISYPDRQAYAVAVLTRAGGIVRPDRVDWAIGESARLAVTALRQRRADS